MSTVFVGGTSGSLSLSTAFFKNIAPGTTIVVKNGTYDAAKITLPSTSNGTDAAPIIIKPETPGGVTFTGATRIDINGNHVSLQDFTFKGTGADSVRIYGDNNTLEGNHFLGAGGVNNTQSSVVLVAPSAQNTHIADNEFAGSLAMSIKVRAGELTSTDQPTNTVIENNHFHDIARLSNNGQECIQVASTGGQWVTGGDLKLGTLIKNNIFERTNGDVEVISMKVGGNTVKGNVFVDMDAAPTVRNGGFNVIDDNILINTRPIRVMGDHSEITNNIIINPKTAAFILANGTPNYEVAEYNHITGNTIVSEKAISVVKFSNESTGKPLFAHDNLFQNNHVQVAATSKLFDFSKTGGTEASYTASNGLFPQLSLDAAEKTLITAILAKAKNAGALLNDYLLDTQVAAKTAAAPVVDLTKQQGDDNNNTLSGTAQNDSLTGNGGKDDLSGLAGNDTLHGGVGYDTLAGGDGNDLLVGSGGADILYGGAGVDVFKFTAASDSTGINIDRIMDFQHGIDKIDISALDYHHLTTGRLADGLLKVTYNPNVDRTYVEGHNDFSFTLSGKVALAESDFVW